jgi:hypothetical protein
MPADLLSAISTGIADANPTAESSRGNTEEEASEVEAESQDNEGGTEEISAEAKPADETPADESAEGKEAAVEPTAEEKAAADAAKAIEDAKTPEQKAAEAAAKKPDPLNDPIPNALKPQTKERIQSLIKAVKQKDEEVVRVSAQFNEIMGHITASKATPQQYGDTLEYLTLVNSGDPVKLEKALTMMLAEVDVLARALGKPVPGVDLLGSHKDLQDEIATGMISRERALEIAGAREQAKIQGQRTANVQQQTQAQQQQEQAISSGRAALNQLEESLKTDPAYPAKRAILVESLKPVFAQIPPAQWANTFKAAYDNLKLPAPAPRIIPKIPTNTPLRPKTPAGGGAPAASSLLDAVSNSLVNAR